MGRRAEGEGRKVIFGRDNLVFWICMRDDHSSCSGEILGALQYLVPYFMHFRAKSNWACTILIGFLFRCIFSRQNSHKRSFSPSQPSHFICYRKMTRAKKDALYPKICPTEVT